MAPLTEARARLGQGAFAYVGVPVPAPNVLIKAEHLQQLYDALK